MYKYIERTPTETEYNKLRELAGWGVLDRETVEKSLPMHEREPQVMNKGPLK